jgi:hypothetical protein
MNWLQWLPEVVRLAFPVVLVIVVARVTGDRGLAALVGGLSVAFWTVRLVADGVVRTVNVRAWRASPGAHLPNTWWFDDKGFTVSDGSFVQFIRWGACMDVHQERDRMVFLMSPIHGHVLPIRFLDAGEKQLEQILGLVARVRAEGRLGRGVD